MSTSVEQAPAKTTAPATTTATSSTSSSSSSGTSNSEAQAAAGLTGEVPPSSSEGDLLATLPTLGEVGTVVLDAMPLASALPVALQLMSIDWVAEWVRALTPEAVAEAGAALVEAVFDALFPVGIGFEVVAAGDVKVPPNLTVKGGGTIALKREKDSWKLTLIGKLGAEASANVAGLASLSGAGDNQAGVTAGAEVLAEAQVVAEGSISNALLLGNAAETGAPSVSQIMGNTLELAERLFSEPGAKLVVSAEGEGTAEVGAGVSTVGASANGSGGFTELDVTPGVEKCGVKLEGSIKGGGGIDGGRLYGFVEGGYAASGSVPGAAASTRSTLRIECWVNTEVPEGTVNPLDLVDEVRVTFINADAADAEERSLDGDGFGDVYPLVKAGADCVDAGEAIGDLRVAREHAVDDVNAIAPFLPDGIIPAEMELDVFVFEAKVEFKTRAEIRVTEEQARVAAPEGSDADQIRDVQRSMAAYRLGEHFEAAGFQPTDDDEVELLAFGINLRQSSMGGIGGSLLGAGMGGDVGMAVTRDIDILDQGLADPALPGELLSA
ncbi:MAG: hypothetical protein FJ102_08265 [Deltaproteobacteria bacterium]|nr:hypothetical protein [Deltaproteobacteria bacterium]